MAVRDFLRLLLLAAIWGGSFLFIRVAVPAFGPPLMMDIRVLLAGGVLLLWSAAARRLPAWPADWPRFLLLGAVNAAFPFTLIAAAELRLPASMAAILNATTPLFAALLAWWWGHEAMTAERVLGVLLGVAGVTVLTGWSPLTLNEPTLFSVAASLLAALCYAGGAGYAGRMQRRTPRMTLQIGQQLGAGAVLLPLAALTRPAAPPATAAVLALLALALLCTVLAYVLYFDLLATVGPTRTLSVTYLVPVFGLLWGALFLQEPVGPGVLAGLALILASVGLVSGTLRWRPRPLSSTDRSRIEEPPERH